MSGPNFIFRKIKESKNKIGDDRYRQVGPLTMCATEMKQLFKLLQSIDAKDTNALAIRSPFFGVNDLALAYA